MRDVKRSTWDRLTNEPASRVEVGGFSINPFDYLARGAQGAISAIADQGSGDLRKLQRESDRQFRSAQRELGRLQADVARMKGQREGEQAAAARFVRPEPVTRPAIETRPAGLLIAAGAVGAAALVGLILAIRK